MWVATSVNLYSFDIHSDVLLGHDFVRRHLPLVVDSKHISLDIQLSIVNIASRSNYVNRVANLALDIVECSLDRLAKINKVIRNVELQGPKYIKEILLISECTIDCSWRC